MFPERRRTQVETRKIMRRLSKENIKEFGRKLGKVAHADPLTVTTTILSQIEVACFTVGYICVTLPGSVSHRVLHLCRARRPAHCHHHHPPPVRGSVSHRGFTFLTVTTTILSEKVGWPPS
jgi:hypothetical protein